MIILQNYINTLQHISWNASVAKDELVGYCELCTGGDNRNPGDNIDPRNQVGHPVVDPFYLCQKLSSYQLADKKIAINKY